MYLRPRVRVLLIVEFNETIGITHIGIYVILDLVIDLIRSSYRLGLVIDVSVLLLLLKLSKRWYIDFIKIIGTDLCISIFVNIDNYRYAFSL